MANPKRRHSKSRRDKRRANWKLTAPAVATCPQCHQPTQPHRACPSCGYYKGEVMLIIKTKKSKKEKAKEQQEQKEKEKKQ